MSLQPFENLRSTHPDRLDAIAALERQIGQTVRLDPNAVIDDAIITQQIGIDVDLVRHFLVELEAWDALVRRLMWICPSGRGTTSEASKIDEFPAAIECKRCGLEHRLHAADVEVRFVPSESLLRDVRSAYR